MKLILSLLSTLFIISCTTVKLEPINLCKSSPQYTSNQIYSNYKHP